MMTILRAGLMVWCLLGGGAALAQESPQGQQQPGDTTARAPLDIVATLEQRGRFDILIRALEQADMEAVFDRRGPVTLFAPTDRAFRALPDDRLERLLGGGEWLTKVLEYHILPGVIPASEFGVLERPQALAGQLRLEGEGARWQVDGQAIESDELRASNGIIHVIDGVLMPWDGTRLSRDGTGQGAPDN